MDTITVGQPWTPTLVQGVKSMGTVAITKPGKYVVQVTGPGTGVIGVYQGLQPVGAAGKLRIEAGAKRGVRLLDPVPHLVVITPVTAGDISLLFRPWSFWDYFSR